MTKPDGIPKDTGADDKDASPWGTWEDLLLAFAVNRHGPHAWDSIASELHKRNLSLTPHTCSLKYLDLQRRFLHDSKLPHAHPLFLDHLRKLRVAELRRELQRYDLNIESLELKMRRMEEERERSLRGETYEADLKDGEGETDADPVSAAPAEDGDPIAGEGIEKDQLSVNESNSTDPESEKLRATEKESEPERTAGEDAGEDKTGRTSEVKSEPDRKPVREDSCNGSSNSIEKSDRRKAEAEPSRGEAGGPVESEAEGGGGEAMKENSDVQSSASRSRKEVEEGEEGSDKVRRGCTSGDDQSRSRAAKDSPIESQPLIGFLQAIRAHKFGSVFERRLRSQESSKYQKLILQHRDLGMIEARLKEGLYSDSVKFFRDLLLLVNNALVFFSKNSAEASAASEIRWLISKEISESRKQHAKSESSSWKHVSLQSLSTASKKEEELEEEREPSRSLMLQPLMVSRKRSSITAKASASASASADNKTKEKELGEEEKGEKLQNSQSTAEEPKITKKRTRDRISSVSASAKKKGKSSQSSKSRATQSGKQSSKSRATQSGKQSSSQQQEEEEEEAEAQAKKNQASSDSKKRGAANFLNRMKQGSPSNNNNSVLLDALKNMPLTSESSCAAVKGSGSKQEAENAKKGARRSRGGETKTGQDQEKENGSPGKRNVGRPPKRAAGKRSREEATPETETTPPPPQPKKRARKLKL
ncbi:uncharacterized protein LOC127263478 isoform X2 [Andrographis paniculata]|uniref:uncharacterized protein LOC127263478 isoform X2 n=1 Tax=Andrographis paniculata TaxID=175694 RepID=UPI0021E71030|nr:uncharacterized protein LOC127263478 isoform X2 [Andrographis paniculata]